MRPVALETSKELVLTQRSLFPGELLDFAGQRVEVTEVRQDPSSTLVHLLGSSFTALVLQKTEKVDFSWNKLADPKFVFHDHSLMEAVRGGNEEARSFFRLLALCHTVMPEEKTEGEQGDVSSRGLVLLLPRGSQ